MAFENGLLLQRRDNFLIINVITFDVIKFMRLVNDKA